MKKSVWMFAAALTCGFALTSCERADNPIGPDPVGPVEPQPVSFTIDFEDEDLGVLDFTDRMVTAIVEDETNGSKVVSFSRSNTSSFAFASYSNEELENATKVKVSFDFNIPAEILGQSAISIGDAAVHNAAQGGFNTSNGQYGYGTNGCIFYLGAYRGKAYGGGNENYFQINGQPAAASQEEHPAADVWGKWFHADVDIDVVNQIVNYTIKQGDEIWWENNGDTLTFVSPNAQTATQVSVFIGNSGTYLVDNITVTKVSSDASIKYADYTIKFVDTNGNALPEDLKTDIVRRGKVGDPVVVLDADKANFTNADGSVKYNYQSDNAEGSVVTEAGTEIKVVYLVEEVQKYQYQVNLRFQDAEGNTVGKRIDRIEGEQFEGQKATIWLKGAYKNPDDGKFYITPITNDGGKGWQGRYTEITGTEEKNPATNVIQKDVFYVIAPDSIVYYGEVEDLAAGGSLNGEVTSWISFNNQPFARFSQGQGIKMADGGYVWTDALPAGTYSVSFYGRCDNSGSVSPVIAIRDAEGNLTPVEAEIADWGNAEMGSRTIAGVNVPEGCSIAIIWAGTGVNVSLDTIMVFVPSPVEAPAE